MDINQIFVVVCGILEYVFDSNSNSFPHYYKMKTKCVKHKYMNKQINNASHKATIRK